jgi:hypothetical protein
MTDKLRRYFYGIPDERAVCDAWLWMRQMPHNFDTEEEVETIIRAAERARLARAIPPLTMSAEQEADARVAAQVEPCLSWSRTIAELDATRASLAALREIAQKRVDYGHNDTCGAVVSGTVYVCGCGHDALKNAVADYGAAMMAIEASIRTAERAQLLEEVRAWAEESAAINEASEPRVAEAFQAVAAVAIKDAFAKRAKGGAK